MVAYNFQRNFGPAILRGIKTFTLRMPRKNRHAGEGDQLQLFTGMRTSNCVRLMDVPCLRSQPLEIHRAFVLADGVRKDNPAYFEHLARIEGFTSFGNLQAWFDRRYGLPCLGLTQIIWNFKEAQNVAQSAIEGVSDHG